MPIPRWRKPVGPLRSIGAREGKIWRIHLEERKQKKNKRKKTQIKILRLLFQSVQVGKHMMKLTKGGIIPLYAGKPGPTGGWGKGKAGLPAGGFLGGP